MTKRARVPLSLDAKELSWLAIVLALILVALVGPHLVPDPLFQDLASRYTPPAMTVGGGEHLLGTDRIGRDVLSRTVHGLGSSVSTAALAVIISVIGIPIGMISAYRGGRFDSFIMRLVDIQLSIPDIVFLLLIVAILEPSFWTVVLVLALVTMIVFIRIARGETIAFMGQDLMLALTSIGVSPVKVLFKHILPNIAGPLIVVATLEFSRSVLAGAALSYLGMGVPPPQPTLGGMISEGQGGLTAGLWWPVVVPSAVLVLLVLSVNRFGERLRVHLDPRQSTRVQRKGVTDAQPS